jgi:hypothetical protein
MAARRIPANPFRPGAGQTPIYLAGRTNEQDQFRRILSQDPVLQNIIVTGLRGVGKTVLLETLKPISQRDNWLWTGNDLSESASLTEERIARRLVVDLSALLGPLVSESKQVTPFGFTRSTRIERKSLEFNDLWNVFESSPGLMQD